jgi:hypothetical protein
VSLGIVCLFTRVRIKQRPHVLPAFDEASQSLTILPHPHDMKYLLSHFLSCLSIRTHTTVPQPPTHYHATYNTHPSHPNTNNHVQLPANPQRSRHLFFRAFSPPTLLDCWKSFEAPNQPTRRSTHSNCAMGSLRIFTSTWSGSAPARSS